jgi:hypothetical protein
LACALPHAKAEADAPTPAPSPTASPRIGWTSGTDVLTSLIDQVTGGPGVSPPEGPAFIAGSSLSPMTPYDTFSSAPNTPGAVGLIEALFQQSYTGRKLTGTLAEGIEAVDGSSTNAAYWSESLLPLINPHLGSQRLGYAVRFPTSAGADNVELLAGSIPLSASLGALDGSWQLKAGWFDLNQHDRFVFVQPPLTNVTPNIGLQTAESLSNGPPTISAWPSPPPGLPLDGVDAIGRYRSATLELSEGALPALPGTSAHLNLGSILIDHGDSARFSADFLQLYTGGTIATTTLFGDSAFILASPQGKLPSSTLGGQRQTIVGVRGVFSLLPQTTATAEYGRAWYAASDVAVPGTEKPGAFYHLGLEHPLGHASVALDAYRFEPRYASAILPYGAPENIWSVAWSWPGVWLKSTYQLADNTVVGSNRQGYRARYALIGGPLELRGAFADFRQIEPASLSNSSQVGFVEGFFLPQDDRYATMGRQKQVALWAAWHPRFGDVSLDFVDDMMHRDFSVYQPADAVSIDVPQLVFSYARTLSKTAVASAGVGRFATRGSFSHGAVANVDFGQNVFFAGAQFAESSHAMIMAQWRRFVFRGLPSISGGRSPDFSGTALIVEQRFHL